MRRFSVGGGLVLLCVLLAMTACAKSKSSGPPDEEAAEGETAVADTQSPEDATNATAMALSATTTAAAQTPQPEDQAPPTAAPTAVPVEATPPPAEPTSAPVIEETAPTAVPAEQAPVASDATSHTVQEGERLFRIALQYGLMYQELAALNGIVNPNLIMVGQILKLPAAGETVPAPSTGDGHHTVQTGENLFRIALRYGMTFNTLAAANNLSYPYTIYPGQQLVIP